MEMTVWVALLRAVNLGVRNKVPMAALRDRLAEPACPAPAPICRAATWWSARIARWDRSSARWSGHPSAERVERLEEHDDARVLDREVYVDYRTHVHGNPLNAAMVSRRLGLHGTERNWATLTKISALAAAC